MPSHMNPARHPMAARAAVRALMMNNCPMPMPDVVTALANPVRPGKAAANHYAHRRDRGDAVADGKDDTVAQQSLPRCAVT